MCSVLAITTITIICLYNNADGEWCYRPTVFPVSEINFLILFVSPLTLSFLLIHPLTLISVHLLCHHIHRLSLLHSFALA